MNMNPMLIRSALVTVMVLLQEGKDEKAIHRLQGVVEFLRLMETENNPDEVQFMRHVLLNTTASIQGRMREIEKELARASEKLGVLGGMLDGKHI